MLWPYDKNTCGEENYYCLYDDCCWLAPLMQSGTGIEQQRRRLEYFGYMSAAMAVGTRTTVDSDVNWRIEADLYLYEGHMYG